MTIELIAEPCVDARHSVVRLLYVKMVQGSVDALGEETVTPLFHLAGILCEVRPSAGEALGPDLTLSVDVAAG